MFSITSHTCKAKHRSTYKIFCDSFSVALILVCTHLQCHITLSLIMPFFRYIERYLQQRRKGTKSSMLQVGYLKDISVRQEF